MNSKFQSQKKQAILCCILHFYDILPTFKDSIFTCLQIVPPPLKEVKN